MRNRGSVEAKSNCRSLDCDARHRFAMGAKARASSLGMTGWFLGREFKEGLRGWAAQFGGASRVFVFPALPGGAKLCRAPTKEVGTHKPRLRRWVTARLRVAVGETDR